MTLQALVDEGKELVTRLRELTVTDETSNGDRDIDMLRQRVEFLEKQLLQLLKEKENESIPFKATMDCTFAKNTAGKVLAALFDRAIGGKVDGLKSWWETGNIQTRSGPCHWRLNPTELRDKRGYNLLHITVDRNLAKESAKVSLAEYLIDTMGFDVNATDLVRMISLHEMNDSCQFGRTSLHYAAMNGYEDLVKYLLTKQGNPLIKDKAGQTALSIVQQVSGISEGIVQALIAAEKNFRSVTSPSASIPIEDATDTIYFIRRIAEFIEPMSRSRFHNTLCDLEKRIGVSEHKDISFDDLCVQTNAIETFESCLTSSAFACEEFLHLMEIEAAKFAIFTPVQEIHHPTQSWANFLERMLRQCGRSYESSLVGENDRKLWYYAVVYQPRYQAIPVALALQKGSSEGVVTKDSRTQLPLEDRILLQSKVYCVTCVNDRTATLDRPFEGTTARDVQVYTTNSVENPPYIGLLKLWERSPGNIFDKMSAEDEMVQDMQRLDPDHEYEISIKIGPTSSRQEAMNLVSEWKDCCKDHFKRHECISTSLSCVHSCPQKLGRYMCIDTMEKIGTELAEKYYGRATYSKTMTPSVSIQRLQWKYKAESNWPGCKVTRVSSKDIAP